MICSACSLCPPFGAATSPRRLFRLVLDALLRMLDLDFVYARFNDAADAGSPEILRVADSCRLTVPPSEISRTLRQLVAKTRVRNRSRRYATVSATKTFRIFPVPLGIHGEMGMIVAGSERQIFLSRPKAFF